MSEKILVIRESNPISGVIELSGAKNAVLVIMASILLTSGISILDNVPASADIYCMIELLISLGVDINFDSVLGRLIIDTRKLSKYEVSENLMSKMRASFLVVGPLLARLNKALVALPGGCSIGARPVDLHLMAFKKLGADLEQDESKILISVKNGLNSARIIFDYPSVGATENALMAAVLIDNKKTELINAALEPEVLDLISVLKKMGAIIKIMAPSTILITGVKELKSIKHEIIPDRLEAGTFLLAAAISCGNIEIPNAPINYMDVFLEKLIQMGHAVNFDKKNYLKFKASPKYKAVSFKTMPYPGFPTDLQSPTMAVLTLAQGVSIINETVFENRLANADQLSKLGAQIKKSDNVAQITGVNTLVGTEVEAIDIRSGASLIIAGLKANGKTVIKKTHHIERGYNKLVEKLKSLGADINYENI